MGGGRERRREGEKEGITKGGKDEEGGNSFPIDWHWLLVLILLPSWHCPRPEIVLCSNKFNGRSNNSA